MKALESEIKKIMKHKDNLYSAINTELVRAEALPQTDEIFEIKVYFKDKKE
ncbi:MAG: UTP:GlnB (protein PII) uridylyltransferase [Oleiphilaceae bacterium]